MKYLHTIVLLLGLTAAACAGEAHDHGHSHADIVIPPTLPELRAEITAQQKKLAASLSARDAVAAHAATDALAAYVRAIPGMMADADDAAKQRVSGMANNAAKAWGEAAHHAEEGHYEAALREAAKADAAYLLLETRLPKD